MASGSRASGAVALVALVAILGVGVWNLARNAQGPTADELLAAVRHDAPALFDSLGPAPGATPRAERSEAVHRQRSTLRFTLEQEFEGPGPAADAFAWYAGTLETRGWKVFDPRNVRDTYVEWCKPPWLLTIEGAVTYEGPPPHHRHRLRLEWNRGFTNDRCPFPGD
jgi:hypothetical protein